MGTTVAPEAAVGLEQAQAEGDGGGIAVGGLCAWARHRAAVPTAAATAKHHLQRSLSRSSFSLQHRQPKACYERVETASPAVT